MECPNEIPSDYKAYRKQQRRWSCGPMQLWAAARQSVRRSTLQPRCNHRAGGCDPMHPGCGHACKWVTAAPYIYTGEKPASNPDPNPTPNPNPNPNPNRNTHTNTNTNHYPNPHPNVTSPTSCYSVLVPLMLLEYAQEVEVEATHHRFMPW
eukprot:scaffold36150_cov54-Phaeocystis_antarctica.AAC.1